MIWPIPLLNARTRLLAQRPYLHHIVLEMQPVEGHDQETMGIDRHLRLFYHPAVLQWPEKDLVGVLYHETLHVLREHEMRLERFNQVRVGRGERPTQRLAENVAADLEINDDVMEEISCGLVASLPDPLLPAKYGFSDGEPMEVYYNLLEKQAQEQRAKQKKSGQGAQPQGMEPGGGDDGSGSNNSSDISCGDATGCGTFSIRAVPNDLAQQAEKQGAEAVLSPEMVERLVEQVGQAIEEAQERAQASADRWSRGRGTVPGALVRWAAYRREAGYSWQRELARLVRSEIVGSAGPRHLPTFRVPSRRQSAISLSSTAILPGKGRTRPIVAVVNDTSGSMGDEQHGLLGDVRRENSAIVEAVGGEIVAISVDARVQGTQRLGRGGNLNLSGGGGTDMRLGIDAATKLWPRPSVIIVLTDGDTPWPSSDVGIPVIAGIVAKDRVQADNAGRSVPGWMRKVSIAPRPEHVG